MNSATIIVHWLHVLFCRHVVGGHISRVPLVEPAVRTLPEPAQQQFDRYVERYATRIFVPVTVGVGVTASFSGRSWGR